MSAPTVEETLALLREVLAETLAGRELPGDEDPLFGPEAQIDSMELVSFVADVEDRVDDRWRRSVVLASEEAMSRKRSPFRHLGALAEYLSELLTHD